MTIENDDLRDDGLYDFLARCFCNAADYMKPGASFYVWYSSKNTEIFTSALRAAGLETREQLVWVKSTFTLGRQDYQWRHEPCLYGWKEGAAHYFIDIRSLSTVTDDIENISRETAIERLKKMCDVSSAFYEDKPVASSLHPTMKPVPLFQKLIRNSTRPGEIVLDLFGGSGTAIIAAEEMDRTCYMMEYDPQYAEVIIARFEEATGQTAVREEPPEGE